MTGIQAELFALCDGKYGDFNAKLIPNIARRRVIGVRTPRIRAYARDLSASPDGVGGSHPSTDSSSCCCCGMLSPSAAGAIRPLAAGVAGTVSGSGWLLVFTAGLPLARSMTSIAPSLAVFATLDLGLLALLSHYGLFALSLPGLAGMVLTVTSAADSSILVLERFREEIRMGRTVKKIQRPLKSQLI